MLQLSKPGGSWPEGIPKTEFLTDFLSFGC
jgi:hypothetical protein